MLPVLTMSKTVALAQEFKKQTPRLSLRAISASLREKGHTVGTGKPYSASAVHSWAKAKFPITGGHL